MNRSTAVPRAFIERRLHSLFGLLMVLFLFEHLVTNSQIALFFSDGSNMFVRSVNFIKNLPYLHAIELLLIGIPFAYHAAFGIRYALQSRFNTAKNDGSAPSLGEYSRNRAHHWQRLTSWVLLVGIILHVGYFRFYKYPTEVRGDGKNLFLSTILADPKLYLIAERLGASLYGPSQIEERAALLPSQEARSLELHKAMSDHFDISFDANMMQTVTEKERVDADIALTKALTKKALPTNYVIAVAPDFGAATLLGVRDAFQSPIKALLYSIFILAAVFHAFNGLWSFMITWGALILPASQSTMAKISAGFMFFLGSLGLIAVWGSFWSTLP